jgi:hypothetical protein
MVFFGGKWNGGLKKSLPLQSEILVETINSF